MRYEVPLKYLSNPALNDMIMRSQQQDLDDEIDGPLRITSPTEFFDQFLKLAKEF